MWGSKNKSASFASGGTTLISKSTTLTGDIEFSGNLEVEGVIRGQVIASEGSDARVRIVEGGCVIGEIHSPVVIINGTVTGDVHSKKHVELAGKAVVEGNVHYQSIEMLKGAQVNGSLLHEKDMLSAKKSLADKEESGQSKVVDLGSS